MTEFDLTALEAADRYRLLTNFVGPRPVALVTTRAEAGHNNGAPISFFNLLSHDPAIVALGIQPRADGRPKDTMANIRRTGEFIVNMVDMPLSEAMLICGLAVEPDVDELALAGVDTRTGSQVDCAVIADSPCAMECRVERIIDYPRRAIVLGTVVHMHIRSDCLDAQQRYVNAEAYHPIARLHADNHVVADRQVVLTPPPLSSILK